MKIFFESHPDDQYYGDYFYDFLHKKQSKQPYILDNSFFEFGPTKFSDEAFYEAIIARKPAYYVIPDDLAEGLNYRKYKKWSEEFYSRIDANVSREFIVLHNGNRKERIESEQQMAQQPKTKEEQEEMDKQPPRPDVSWEGIVAKQKELGRKNYYIGIPYTIDSEIEYVGKKVFMYPDRHGNYSYPMIDLELQEKLIANRVKFLEDNIETFKKLKKDEGVKFHLLGSSGLIEYRKLKPFWDLFDTHDTSLPVALAYCGIEEQDGMPFLFKPLTKIADFRDLNLKNEKLHGRVLANIEKVRKILAEK